jgi:SAM-dependent methyltransferase
MTTLLPSRDARDAYEALAPAYDALTANYDHEGWLSALEQLALGHGLRGRRLLDLACGTGKSFMPLLRRGYSVTGCDISPEMLACAGAKAPGARLLEADIRSAGALGTFDLVTCLDDALNYLLEPDEVLGALRTMRANLATDGLALFDVNTLRMYRAVFAADQVSEAGGALLAWRGTGEPELQPGALVEFSVEAFRPHQGLWLRSTSVHRQRHWPVQDLLDAAEGAGLRVLAVHGQRPGARLEDFVDQDRHTKVVFVAARDDEAMSHEGVIA